jgi:NCS1 family nucleobase:cation symporter-1
VGSLFSSILPLLTNILPDWWSIYGWFFGVLIGGGVYYVAMKLRPYRRPA